MEINTYGNKYLYEKLLIIDSTSAEQIDINDRKRVIRALEIYNETNKPMSHYNKDFRRESDKYNLIMIGLNMDNVSRGISRRNRKFIKYGL